MNTEFRKPERARRQRLTAWCVVLAGAYLAAACADEPPPPRNFAVFMEDRIAREGTLARCNADIEAASRNIECANARRAAAALALRRERELREQIERESAERLALMQDALRAREMEAARAAELAAAEEQRAYEELWDEPADAAPESAPGAVVLEEVVVPSRFVWRPPEE